MPDPLVSCAEIQLHAERADEGIVTDDALPRINRTPSTQCISTVEEMSVREAKPVSGSVLVEIAVRALWCQAVACWREFGWVGRDVFMPSIVFFVA